jgi:hypothetical protein
MRGSVVGDGVQSASNRKSSLRRGSVISAADMVSAIDDQSNDASWISLTMMGLSRQARQVEARASVVGNSLFSLGNTENNGPPRNRIRIYSVVRSYNNITSKIFQPAANEATKKPSSGGKGSIGLNTTSSAHSPVRSLAQLHADLPNLSLMKGEPWSRAPGSKGGGGGSRPSSALNTSATSSLFARPSEPPAMKLLDPFSKSLVLNGVLTPPLVRRDRSKSASSGISHSGSQPRGTVNAAATSFDGKRLSYDARKDTMKRASQELRGMLGSSTVAQHLRSDRVMALLLADPRQQPLGQRPTMTRPSSSLSRH